MVLTEQELNALVDRLQSSWTLTAYLETAPDDDKTRKRWRDSVTSQIGALRQTLRLGLRVERSSFERSALRLMMRLRGLPRPSRSPGWVLVIADGDVHHFTALPTRVANQVHWTLGPCLKSYPVAHDGTSDGSASACAFTGHSSVAALASVAGTT